MSYRIEHGDCLDLLKHEPANSWDAMVTDPPGGIAFMGRDWDKNKGGRKQWVAFMAKRFKAALRVLKPGAHAMVWALPRTAHWTGCALEDAGFEVRDGISHAFGSGFPKSHNLPGGLGTALKPSHELWFLVRKPLEKGLTVAQNHAKWGTGVLNIDGCRVAHASASDRAAHDAQVQAIKARGGSMENSWKNSSDLSGANDVNDSGRWPPNLVLTHDARCRRVGTRAVKANPTWDTPNRDTAPSAFTGGEVSKVRHANGRDGEATADKSYADSGSSSFAMKPGQRRDDTEDVALWECVDGCPVRVMDRQSGHGQSGFMAAGTTRANGLGFNGAMPAKTAADTIGDSGTASRFFPQFQWDPELDDLGEDGPWQRLLAGASIAPASIALSHSCLGTRDSASAGVPARPSKQRGSEDSTHHKSSRAQAAANRSSPSRATIGSSAPSSVQAPSAAPCDQDASFAAAGVGLCGTDTAPSLAQTGPSGAASSESSYPAPGSRETGSDTTPTNADGITWTPCTELRPLRSLWRDALIQLRAHASSAETRAPTDTTTTTESLPRSAGSAEAATFVTTSPSTEHGDLDCVELFRYAAKASRSERDKGLEHFKGNAAQRDTPNPGGIDEGSKNVHPTVKSVELIRYFTRLVTPRMEGKRPKVGSIFLGSGTDGVAALLEGCDFVGFELNDTDEEPFVSIARARCEHAMGHVFIPRESLRAESAPKQRSLFEVVNG